MTDRDEMAKKAAEALGHRTPVLSPAEVAEFVRPFIERRESFLRAVGENGSPLYVIEQQVLVERARQFAAAFRERLGEVRVYYAVKTNNCPQVARILAGAGVGLDVSSGLELRLALDAGASEIVFSGPGKTDSELALAVEHRERVTVLMDSFRELGRLERIAARAGAAVRAGVRLTTDERGLWRKFGIPLAELGRFIDEARACPHVRLAGVQFHTSWNMDAAKQVAFIARLGAALGALDAGRRAAIEFVDIGGGYWPPQGEWLLAEATREGRVSEAIEPGSARSMVHHRVAAAPIEEFAARIAEALRAEVFPHLPGGRCAVCAEPGRWIVNDAMHILVTVVDRKGDDIAITDGATNAVGWERFESDYFPVINLTRPALEERGCYVLGSLCTPHDVWGYGYFGSDIQPGDVLLIPTQGAYTYSLRQEFIKPLPRVVVMGGSGE